MFDIRKIQENVIFGVVKAQSNEAVAAEVVYGKENTANKEANKESNADWVKNSMKRLEACFDDGAIKKIRMNCQCGFGMDEKISLVKELKAGAKCIEEFVAPQKAKEAGLWCKDGELYLQFNFCPCPMLAEVDRLETNTWCQCTTGYSKLLFEKAFGCDVDVELLKSVKMGDDICLMKIILNNPKW